MFAHLYDLNTHTLSVSPEHRTLDAMHLWLIIHCSNQDSKGGWAVAYLGSHEHANVMRSNERRVIRWVWCTNLVWPDRGKDELWIAPGQPIHD